VIRRLFLTAGLAIVLSSGFVLSGDSAQAPDAITYAAKPGAVTFSHAKHVELAENDCKKCHETLFKQERGNLDYKAGMHKKAEQAGTSCAACHVAGGSAFESKGNCEKCHEKE